MYFWSVEGYIHFQLRNLEAGTIKMILPTQRLCLDEKAHVLVLSRYFSNKSWEPIHTKKKKIKKSLSLSLSPPLPCRMTSGKHRPGLLWSGAGSGRSCTIICDVPMPPSWSPATRTRTPSLCMWCWTSLTTKSTTHWKSVLFHGQL